MKRFGLAGLAVTDRDYLTVPADQIKDIRPVLTMVGGRAAFDAAAEPRRRQDNREFVICDSHARV